MEALANREPAFEISSLTSFATGFTACLPVHHVRYPSLIETVAKVTKAGKSTSVDNGKNRLFILLLLYFEIDSECILSRKTIVINHIFAFFMLSNF